MRGRTSERLRGGPERCELHAGQDKQGATLQERDRAREDKGLDLEAASWQSDLLEGRRRDAGGTWERAERDFPLAVQPRALLVSMLGGRRHR